MKTCKLRINKKIICLILAGIIGAFLIGLGGQKVYYRYFSLENKIVGTNVTYASETNVGYITLSSINEVNYTNPFIVQGSDSNYYLYGTNGVGKPSDDEKDSVEYYISSYSSGGASWDGPAYQTITGLPSDSSKPISSKVYKIGDYYYLIFTLIFSDNDASYDPYNSETKSSIYYAVSKTLDQDTNWTFKGEVPYGNTYFLENSSLFASGDTTQVNLNHMNGSFLVEDTSENAIFDDGDNIFFYYHFEAPVNGSVGQESYSIKLTSKNGTLSLVTSTPQKLLSLESGSTDVIDDPYVVKDNNVYKLYYSSKINSSNLYTYNVAYAVGSSQSGPFTVENSSFLTERNPGGMSIFQIWTKDDITNKLYSDNYYVFHRATADNLKIQPSNASFYIRKDITKSITDEGTTAIMPCFSGVADANVTGTYRNTVAKELYDINGSSALQFNGVETTGKSYKLSINLNARQDIRELIIYTNSTSSSTINIVPNVNVNTNTTQINYRNNDSNYAKATQKNGVIWIVFPYNVTDSSIPTKIKNIEVTFNADIGSIKDIQVVSLTSKSNEYDNNFYVNYGTNKPNDTKIESGCTSGLISSKDKFLPTCQATLNNYTFTYSAEKDSDHYGKLLRDDYNFNYFFEPTVYSINYDLNGGVETEGNTKKYAIEEFNGATNYKNVVINNPTRIGYTFGGWGDVDNKNSVVTSTVISKLTTLKNYNLKAIWTANKINVTYNANASDTSWANTTTKVISQTFDENYTVQSITRTGYTFEGWYTDPENGTLVTAETKATNPDAHTLYAHWAQGHYIVTFDPNGGTVNPTLISRIYNEEYGELPVPIKVGYTFKNWTKDKVSGTAVTATTKCTDSSHTLYANWTANNITVNFDANSGTCSPTTQTKLFGSTYNKASNGSSSAALPTPTKTGYTFEGWYTEATGGTKVEGTTTVTNPDTHTLYAHWKAIDYVVTLDLNKGSGSSTPTVPGDISSITVSYDGTYEKLPTPTRDGYDFTGWYTKKSAGTKINNTDTVNIVAATTYYAQWSARTYNVIADLNDGSVPSEAKTITFDAIYDTTNFTKTPTRSNYEFLGWYTEPSVPSDVTSPSYIVIGTTKLTTAKDHTIYAIWKGISKTVTYDCNGGTIASKSKATTKCYYGDNYIFPADPTFAGHTFTGWYTAATGGTKITNKTIFNKTADQTVYAQWNVATFTVTYDSQGGSSVDSKKYTYGDTYGELPVPVRSGYTFAGWYTAATGGTKYADNSKVAITTDSTFYAHWTPNNIIVNFDANSGTCSPTTQTKLFGSTYNKASNGSSSAALPTPTKTGYTFEGWYTEATGGTKVEGTTTVTNPDTHTLYAHWRPNKFTISLNANGGTVSASSVSVEYDGTYANIPVPTRKGYTFTGWYNKSSSGTKYNTDQKVSLTNADASTVTFYAYWSINTYKVSYDSQGGTAVTTTSDVVFNSKYSTLPITTRDGYDFAGWYDAKTGGNKIIGGTTVMTTDSNHTLYAQWTAKTYKISLDANGGSINTSSVTVTYDQPYGDLGTPIKIGKTFVGWYTEATGGSKIDSTTIVKITADSKFYAQWKTSVYDVSLNAQGGTTSISKLSIEYDGKYSGLPTPTRSGFTFSGWYDAAKGGKQISNGDSIISNSNHTLYAHWDTTRYKITLNALNGTCDVASINVGKGEYYEDLPTPTKVGYEFDGWYTSESGGSKVTTSTIKSAIGEETLYARYNAKKYTITLKYQNDVTADGTKQVTYDSTYSVLPTSTKKGYTFQGWYTESSAGSLVKTTDTVKITNDITLYAHWKVNTYVVTYDSQGGTQVTDKSSITYGTKYPTLPTVTKTGYTFAGWYDAKTGGNKITGGATVMTTDSDHTLYAQWTANSYTVTFNKNGGNIDGTSIKVAYDSKYAILPTTGTKKGYTFAGWKDSNGNVITNETIYKTTANQTITAQWTPVEYTIKYGRNGSKTKKYTIETSTFTLDAPDDIAGYTFTGYTSSDIKTPTKSVSISKGSIGDRSYTDNWTPIEYKYVVDGTSNTYTIESPDITLTEPTKKGYTFTGWSGTDISSLEKNVTIKKGSIGNRTYTSNWTPTVFTIIYGDLTKEYTIETPTFTLDLPAEKTGYTFAGYTGEGITTPAKTVTIKKGTTGNKRYEAIWNAASGESFTVVQSESKKGQNVSSYLTKNSKYKKIKNKDGSSKSETDLVKTGDIAVDSSNNETVIIVFMDINSDGKISTTDYVKLWNHLDKNNSSSLDGDSYKYARMAADINGDNRISTLDCVKLWNSLSKK